MSTVHTCMDEPSSNCMYLTRDQGGARMDFAIVSINFIISRVLYLLSSPHLNIFEICNTVPPSSSSSMNSNSKHRSRPFFILNDPYSDVIISNLIGASMLLFITYKIKKGHSPLLSILHSLPLLDPLHKEFTCFFRRDFVICVNPRNFVEAFLLFLF